MDGATAVEAAVQLQALRGDVSTLVAEVGLLQGVATTRAEVTADERRAVLDEVAALRGQMSTVLHTLALALQDQPGKTESELYAAVAGLSKLCETTLRHCQETAGAQVAVAAKLAELQEETSVVAAALHRLRGIFQGDVENAMRQMVRDVSAVHQEGCNVPVSNQPQASVPQGVPSRTPEALVRPQKPRPPPEEVTLLRRMLREHRQAQLDSSPRSTGTPRRQEATQAWPSILQRRSLQRPMYPMWRPSRRPSPQWRDVGMPNVQQPFLADALQHRSAASRPASPPQPIHRQRGLQEAQERLHEAKAYQELLELQEIQRRLQHMGLEEAQVVNEHPAAASGGSSFRSWMPERPVEKSPDMPNVRFPQAAGDGPQWGDLQLQLHEQLETLRQKLRSHSTKELKTEAIKADRSLEAQAGFAEFMKRQHDSLAERLFQSGFIPELNASSGSMSTVLPTGRHESEDTEQRESEPASPELSQLLHPAAAPVEAQRKAQRPQYFQLSPDTSQNILQDSNSPSFDGFEAYQQPFVLSPCGHAGRASSPASGLSEKEVQLDSSPRRRSLQRPMYPMWRPSRRPSPQWRDVGMPNVQQPFLADALQQGWACRSASPPQQLHQQLGHLQQVEEQLHKLKEPTRRRDVHQVYQELLQLQEIQRSLQHLGLEEEHVVTSEQSPAASCGGILFAQTGERGNNSASFTPEQLVEMEKLTGTPSVPFPRFGAGEGPQWGDLQLRLLQQLEMLQQKQPTQSTKEVQTDPAEDEDGPESESQAEFMKRQHDSLAERLFQSGFIPELNASSGSMSTVLPTGRHESEDTEQRESEPASPELSQLSRPSALAAGPKAQAQQKAERSSDGNIVQDSKLRSSHGTQESDSLSFDRFEVCQQSFVLSPSGHVRTASSPASGGLAEKEAEVDEEVNVPPTTMRARTQAEGRPLRDSGMSSPPPAAEVSRQSPEPHPVPMQPSPSFGWKEMQNHTLRNWFAEFSPSPVRNTPQQTLAPEVFVPSEPVCLASTSAAAG